MCGRKKVSGEGMKCKTIYETLYGCDAKKYGLYSGRDFDEWFESVYMKFYKNIYEAGE